MLLLYLMNLGMFGGGAPPPPDLAVYPDPFGSTVAVAAGSPDPFTSTAD